MSHACQRRPIRKGKRPPKIFLSSRLARGNRESKRGGREGKRVSRKRASEKVPRSVQEDKKASLGRFVVLNHSSRRLEPLPTNRASEPALLFNDTRKWEHYSRADRDQRRGNYHFLTTMSSPRFHTPATKSRVQAVSKCIHSKYEGWRLLSKKWIENEEYICISLRGSLWFRCNRVWKCVGMVCDLSGDDSRYTVSKYTMYS